MSLVGLAGFEPATSRLSGGRSNQLSYRPDLGPFLSDRAGRSSGAVEVDSGSCVGYRDANILGNNMTQGTNGLTYA